ncbi:MAG: mRNA-decapping enzyme subunit 2 [Geoglossum umbratile]|nr:MAG: mRNA-decapping enzyme subunit 2 [Geoglossum umbratile]
MTETKMRLEDWLDDLCVRFIINLPQEELESVERICFQVEEAQWFYEDFIRPLDPNLPSLNLKQFSLRIFQHCPLFSEFSPYHHTQAFSEFLSYKTRVPVRGAIMLNEEMDEVVLVKGWKKGANWSFPRGKINKDEKDLDCAIREVYEETGFDARQAGVVPEDSEAKFIEVTMREQNMRLYVFRGIPMDTDFQPRTRKEISKIQWHRLSELPTFKKSKQNQNDKDNDTLALSANKFYMVAPFLKPLKTWIAAQKKLDAGKSSVPKHLAPIIQTGELMTEEEPVTENEVGEVKGNLMALLGLSKKAEEPSSLPEVSDAEASMKDTSARLKRLLSVSESSQTHDPVQTQVPASDASKSSDLLALLQKGLGSSSSGVFEPTIAPQPPSELSSSLTPNRPLLNSNISVPSSFPILSLHSKIPQNENSFPPSFAQQPQPSNLSHEQYYHYPPRSFPPQTSYFQPQMSQMPSFVPTQQPLYNGLSGRNPASQHVGPQQLPHPLPYPHQQTYEITRSPVGSQFLGAHSPPQGHGTTLGGLNSHSQALLNVLKHGNATELSATPSPSASSVPGQKHGHGSNGVVSPVFNTSPAGVPKPRNEHQNALLDLFRSPPTETTSLPRRPTAKNPPVELSAHLSPGLSDQNSPITAPQNEMAGEASRNEVPVQQNHESPSLFQLKPISSVPPTTKVSVPSTRPRFEGPVRKSKGKKTVETRTADQRSETPPVSLGAQSAGGASQTNGTRPTSNLITTLLEKTASKTTSPQEGQDAPKRAMSASFQPQILRRPAQPALKTPPAFDRRSSQSAQQAQTLLSLFGKASTSPVSTPTNALPSIAAATVGGAANSTPSPGYAKQIAGSDAKPSMDKQSQVSAKKPSSISSVDRGFLLGYLEDVARSSRRY